MFSGKRSPSTDPTVPLLTILRTSGGLTLLELIIAFVVLQVAIVTFAQFFTAALDFSLKARRTEMAQMLAQSKMEELIRTFPDGAALTSSPEERGAPQLLNDHPGTFADFVHAHPEDIEPFMWVAEAAPSQSNPKVSNLTLHVYMVTKRTKSEKASAPEQDFYVSDDREWFTFIHTLSDGSVEVLRGQEKLRISSAVALP
jgi:type II secretory pathway pseudopilin PulG